MTKNLQNALERIENFGLKCASDEASRFAASIDNSRYNSMPDAVVYARSEDDVSHVLKTASEFGVYVTPRGAGSGCSGAALPLSGGILAAAFLLSPPVWIFPFDCEIVQK